MAPKSFFSRGPYEDPCPALPVDRNPDGAGVGPWVPRDKHRRLAEYLHGSREAWKRWPERVLIDPFCGPGRIQVAGEPFTRDGGALVAWRELHAAGVPFTRVLIGDLDGAKVSACAQRVEALGGVVTPFSGPAKLTVPQMIAAVPRNALCMAYVDPYNLTLLDYQMLSSIASLRVDLAVHFSTMDLQRNIVQDIQKDLRQLDQVAPGWRKHVDAKSLGNKALRAEFFAYWRTQMTALGFKHSREMPIIHNTIGSPIYRLVFFARHSTPLRIWGDVARGKTRDMFTPDELPLE